jgi:hypothetical protein
MIAPLMAAKMLADKIPTLKEFQLDAKSQKHSETNYRSDISGEQPSSDNLSVHRD